MVRCMALFTNNPVLFSLSRQDITPVCMEDTAYAVTLAARDKVHQGWRLLNHPLYGNFRPYHQPFRSLLLSPPKSRSSLSTSSQPQAMSVSVDALSLDLLEQALAVYRSCADRWATPQSVPRILFEDCSFLDAELMRATLETAS